MVPQSSSSSLVTMPIMLSLVVYLEMFLKVSVKWSCSLKKKNGTTCM
jgi:hypothetical protein